MKTRVSLAELAAADISLRPAEAAAIVSDICRRCASGELRGVPPPGVIRLSIEGDISIEGPMTTGDDVARAAQLLNDLLAPFDGPPEYRASGALRLVIARALGTLDIPPYSSLPQFCGALARFAAADPRETASTLVRAWQRAHAVEELEQGDPEALSISDIRRARRATGLSLQDVAAVAGVAPTKLRDLEWGYTRDWRADDDGRAEVIRYARAAGLDERLVLSIAWPLIEQSLAPPADEARDSSEAVSTALVPSGPQLLVPHAQIGTPAATGRKRGWRSPAVAAIAIVATIAALTAALLRLPRANDLSAHTTAARSDLAQTAPDNLPAERDAAPAPAAGSDAVPAAAPDPVPAAAVSSAAAPRNIRPAPERTPARRRASAPRAQPAAHRTAQAPERHAPRKASFFGRELFRIVIR